MKAVVALAATVSLALCTTALAAPTPEPFATNDAGGFRNILPAGQNGHADASQVAAFLASGARPPHNADQLPLYDNLIEASPTLDPARIGDFFKDATFGVPDGEAEFTYSPRDDVTIQRDGAFGVPHIYGAGRPGAMYGAGYVGAEDRLFLMDILRHLGRAELSSFIGGSQGNRDMDADQWRIAPYTEADLQKQFDQTDDLYGTAGRQVQTDVTNYIAGINKYICEAVPANPDCVAAGISPAPTTGSKNGATPAQKLPGAYAAIFPNGDPAVDPELFSVTDVIATASLVGGIFGKGGGGELDSAQILKKAIAKFGADGNKVFDDFRRAEDPEAPKSADGNFPYRVPNPDPEAETVAMPDAGTLNPSEVVARKAPRGRRGGVLQGLSKLQGASNALLVSGAKSESGTPIAVIGPQTGYFSPQILMEIDIHAPAVNGEPAIDARGAAFPGVNLYVQLGRGPDYAWSATSAGQDIIDTFALELCNTAAPGTPVPDLETADGYMYRNSCEKFEPLTRMNRWVPNAADMTPPGMETLVTNRTKLGLEIARARVGGDPQIPDSGTPVAYVKLRSTYMHEADSALGFLDFNTPDRMNTSQEFKQAAARIGFTFNWFYVNGDDIAYFNSGNNPVRPAGSDPDFPVMACPTKATDRCKYEWEGWNPDNFTSAYTPFAEHPQQINKPYFTSWNNKQATAYSAADDNFAYGPVHRSEPLDDGILARIEGGEKMTVPELVDAMEDAATVDLRGNKVLGVLLRTLGNDETDPAIRDAIAKLAAWQADGAHRRDFDEDGTYEHSEAVKIMDAWWPRLVEQMFKPTLDPDLYDALVDMIQIDNPPHTRRGSAYISGWYGYVDKDLRSLLGEPVSGAFSRVYCGDGVRSACESALRTSLGQAIDEPRATTYADSTCSSGDNAALDAQLCFDAIEYSAAGAVTMPLQTWQNRPTFQQTVEVGAQAAAVPDAAPGATPQPKSKSKKKKSKPQSTRKAPSAVRAVDQTGDLPFTGFLVALVALLGALMLAGGVALRRRLGSSS